MIRARTPILLSIAAAMTLSACAEGQMFSETDPNRQAKQGALIGAIGGAVAGRAIGGNNDDALKNSLAGAVAGAAAGGLIGNQLDKQEAELRQQLGNNVGINNTGDRLIVTMPQDILFAVDSSTVNSALRGDLLTVANSLKEYPQSRVQVIGHTDNTGSAAYNQGLSERRANAVSDVLMSGGVSFNRIESFGRGEDRPVASNLTPEGRAQNRRVEIVILPTS